MRVSARCAGSEPISGGFGFSSSRYSQIATVSEITSPSSSSSAGTWPAGFFEQIGLLRFAPAIRSTFTVSGNTKPFSAANMRTSFGFGPSES